MRVAIVDLGTNTFNLLIADLTKDKNFRIVLKEKRAVKLGASGLKVGIIQPDAFERGLNSMKEYKEIIDYNQVDSIKAIATSAMRDSSNSSEFKKAVHSATGITIDIISGMEEATLIQKGVELTLPDHITDYVIMDIGGGSTEFIIVKNKEVVWSKSYNLGVSRLLDWLQPSEPIQAVEIDKLYIRFKNELGELASAIETFAPQKLVGSSGSFDSIHDILEWEKHNGFSSNHIDFNEISLIKFKALHEQFLSSTLAERLAIKGLLTMRADMMVISSLEIMYIITMCKTSNLYRSSYALKEGLLVSI